MSGMSAMLAFGYILSDSLSWKWDLVSPEWDDEEYEMKWPEWVDPDDPVTSMGKRLDKAGLKAVKIDMYGNLNCDEVPVLLWAANSEHEADDGPALLTDFVYHSTAWTSALNEALEVLEIEPAERSRSGPQWILAPSAY